MFTPKISHKISPSFIDSQFVAFMNKIVPSFSFIFVPTCKYLIEYINIMHYWEIMNFTDSRRSSGILRNNLDNKDNIDARKPSSSVKFSRKNEIRVIEDPRSSKKKVSHNPAAQTKNILQKINRDQDRQRRNSVAGMIAQSVFFPVWLISWWQSYSKLYTKKILFFLDSPCLRLILFSFLLSNRKKFGRRKWGIP